jgi:two-component system phosphate regulon sensor histidine kinase PhoR
VHITNAILNLLTNAVKYSDKKPHIRILSYNRDGKIILEVSDNGVGIPLKYHRFIFDKYFRVPTGDVHDIKGFGIGLSYVKSVVEAHGGKVTLVSEPGKGSTFFLTFEKKG